MSVVSYAHAAGKFFGCSVATASEMLLTANGTAAERSELNQLRRRARRQNYITSRKDLAQINLARGLH